MKINYNLKFIKYNLEYIVTYVDTNIKFNSIQFIII